LYDGIVDPAWGHKGENPAQICLTNNAAASFLNFDAAGSMKHPVKDLRKYACKLPALSSVSIPQVTDAPVGGAAKGVGSN